MFGVGGKGDSNLTVAQLIERVALPRFHLPVILMKLDDRQTVTQTAKGATGVDLGQLTVITDEDDLGPASVDIVE